MNPKQKHRGPSNIEASAAEMDTQEKTVASANNLVKKGVKANAEPAVQRKMSDEEETVQRKEKGVGGGEVSSGFQSALLASKGTGTNLDGGLQKSFGAKFGTDFGNVKVHNNNRAHQLAQQVNAKAFTVGEDIYFNKGEYQPGSKSGKKLLAHELTHTVQQKRDGNRLQRKSLNSDGEKFLFTSGRSGEFDFSSLVGAVIKRYGLDHGSARDVALWLNEKYNLLYNIKERKILTQDLVVLMPRYVAFFQIDYVDPFNPFDSSSPYFISPQAKEKAIKMWGQHNIFIGFKRGRKIANPALREINFNPGTDGQGNPLKVSSEEMDLMSQRPSGSLSPGHYHIVVTGSTTQDPTAAGKSIGSEPNQKVASSKQGIILFAGTYSRLGYKQTVPKGDSGQEIAELMAHEIGHFLFNMDHNYDPIFTDEGMVVKGKKDFMKGGAQMDPDDKLRKGSLDELEEAFNNGGIPKPETPTPK